MGNGREMLEKLIAVLPAANAATLTAWNDYAREQYEAKAGGDPPPFEPYTLDRQMTDDDMQFYDALPKSICFEHLFLAVWLGCGKDSTKGSQVPPRGPWAARNGSLLSATQPLRSRRQLDQCGGPWARARGPRPHQPG